MSSGFSGGGEEVRGGVLRVLLAVIKRRGGGLFYLHLSCTHHVQASCACWCRERSTCRVQWRWVRPVPFFLLFLFCCVVGADDLFLRLPLPLPPFLLAEAGSISFPSPFSSVLPSASSCTTRASGVDAFSPPVPGMGVLPPGLVVVVVALVSRLRFCEILCACGGGGGTASAFAALLRFGLLVAPAIGLFRNHHVIDFFL